MGGVELVRKEMVFVEPTDGGSPMMCGSSAAVDPAALGVLSNEGKRRVFANDHWLLRVLGERRAVERDLDGGW